MHSDLASYSYLCTFTESLNKINPINADSYTATSKAVYISLGPPMKRLIYIIMYIIVYIQELSKSSSSSSDQKIWQQNSEIEMLPNTNFKMLRKQHTQLIDIHSKCEDQKETSKSVSTQTDDQV